MKEPKCKNGHVWSVPTGERFVEGQPCECGQKPYELNPHEREVVDLEAEIARLRAALRAATCKWCKRGDPLNTAGTHHRVDGFPMPCEAQR